MGRVYAIVNQKGGVGKTTTAVNLAAALAAAGQRTLVVDSDPQSNATRSLGVVQAPDFSLYDVLLGENVGVWEAIVYPGLENLALLPATPSLAGAEVELVAIPGRERRLGEVLAPAVNDFDFVLIDCPPSLGLLSVNALVAADGVIVPVQCEYLSLEGVGLLMHTLELVRARLNPRLAISGVVLTMFDPRTRLSSEVVDEVSRHFPEVRFETVIPRSIRLGEAPSYGETILTYAPSSSGAMAYTELARELIGRAPERIGTA
jgi:chromosome partitioning protein